MMKNEKMLKNFCLCLIMTAGLLLPNLSNAQALQEEDRKIGKQTNKLLKEAEEKLGENDFPSAEANYRKAVAKNPESEVARYNMANMYYSKEKAGSATERYKEAAEVSETKEAKHKIFHNMGNSFMDQKKYKEAVEAYKNALRSNPSDEETRYNLALAKKMLEEEQKDGGGGEDDKEEQDKGDKDQDQKDQGDKEQDKQDGEDKEDKGGEEKEDKEKESEKPGDKGDPKEQKEPEGKDGKEEPQPKQTQPGQLSPQQVKSLLEAMNNEEKKVQDKINARKAQGPKTRTGKDW